MKFTLEQIEEKIAICQAELVKNDLQPEDRAIFRDALAKAREIKNQLLAQFASPVTTPPEQSQEGIKLQYPQTNAARNQPPIARQPEAAADELAAYLADQGKKAGVDRQDSTASPNNPATPANTSTEKKTVCRSINKPDHESIAPGLFIENTAERVVIMQETGEAALVPRYRFSTKKGEQILLPGQIRSLFKERMKNLSALKKKPLHYSRMLHLAAAYYQAMCDFEEQQLGLEYFGFSSPHKKNIFEVIQSRAEGVVVERVAG